MNLDLSIYDREFNLLGFVDSYSSLLWKRSYFKAGSFRIECPLTDQNVKLFQKENILRKKDIMPDGTKRNADEAGVIEHLYKFEGKKLKYLIAEGRFLSSYLDRRTIEWTKTHSGTCGDVVRAFINDCTSTSRRAIPGLKIGNLSAFSDRVDKQATWKNLLSLIEDISATTGHGFRVRPDFVNKGMTFELYDGVDRSVSQIDHNRVIFSDDYGNLNEVINETSDLFYKDYFYVGGQGEGAERRVIEFGDKSASGLDLREMFIDARDIMLEEEMTEAEYDALLKTRGMEKQKDCVITDSVEATVIPTMNFTYKKDYDLGDIVTIEKEPWGIKSNKRITALMEQYKGSVFEILPTFGDPLPTKLGGNANEW